MTEERWGEIMAMIGMAHEVSKPAFAVQMPIDAMFQSTMPAP